MDAVAADVRLKALEMITKAKSSHIGSCFSCTDMLVSLYDQVMKYDPKNPEWEGRDRFILSKGHAAAAYYAVLAKAGFFNEKELFTFGQHLSTLTTHVSDQVPGVEVDTGSLGHGLSIGVGMAIALQHTGQQVYVLCSDGELNEGSVWEAIMLAGHLKLTNLTLIIDQNDIQACGLTKDVLDLHPIAPKINKFGWHTIVCNGHDMDALHHFCLMDTPFPRALIACTIKGKGVSFMENELCWHYNIPSEEEYELAVKELEHAKGIAKPYQLLSRT